jgi:hypothetical protein
MLVQGQKYSATASEVCMVVWEYKTKPKAEGSLLLAGFEPMQALPTCLFNQKLHTNFVKNACREWIYYQNFILWVGRKCLRGARGALACSCSTPGNRCSWNIAARAARNKRSDRLGEATSSLPSAPTSTARPPRHVPVVVPRNGFVIQFDRRVADGG